MCDTHLLTVFHVHKIWNNINPEITLFICIVHKNCVRSKKKNAKVVVELCAPRKRPPPTLRLLQGGELDWIYNRFSGMHLSHKVQPHCIKMWLFSQNFPVYRVCTQLHGNFKTSHTAVTSKTAAQWSKHKWPSMITDYDLSRLRVDSHYTARHDDPTRHGTTKTSVPSHLPPVNRQAKYSLLSIPRTLSLRSA
jgi:hypothetical protein